ncbi:MAG: MarR family transcriptional regulator [Alphaproteobacteria bacterium]|nr:MAG: MarR family transcriptional regulator [Alphaproteobacteria bacterium]
MTTDVEEVKRECAALRTRMASRRITRAYDEALRPLDLKVTQFTLLVAIRQGAPRSISELADALAMERTTLTRNLKLLEGKGLIEIAPEGHRRARTMRLTSKGEEKLDQAMPVWRAAQDRLVRRLGRERWDAAKTLLEELAAVS